VKLRRGRSSDLDALVRLEGEVFKSRRFAGHLISKASFRRFLDSANCTVIIAQVGKQIAGYVLVLYRSNFDFARMYSIGVHPDFRRRGIARLLAAAAEADAQRRGRQAMRLEVRADDAGAVSLYETCGYRRFGTRLGYYGGDIDALRFAKTIAKEPHPRP
jgi:ribosomal protein S18 acetylase RimI-like enzyme